MDFSIFCYQNKLVSIFLQLEVPSYWYEYAPITFNFNKYLLQGIMLIGGKTFMLCRTGEVKQKGRMLV